jgi:hypothetical protein
MPPPAGGAPWTQRLIAALPVAPLWTGLGLAALELGAYLLAVALFGRGDAALGGAVFRENLGPRIVHAVLIGYAPAAMAYSRRSQLRAFGQLRPVLRGSGAELEDLRTELAAFDMRWLRLAGWAGVAIFALLARSDPSWALYGRLHGLPLYWGYFDNGVTFWLLGRMIARELRVARFFSRIGAERVEVDLHDLRSLAPFTQRGLQGSLIWILLFVIFSPIYLEGLAARWSPLWVIAMAGIAVASLVLPVAGVHRSLAQHKADALERLAAALRTEEAALLGPPSPAGERAAARLPALLALRSRLEAVREWPFDAPTLVRFVLYLVLGLGSWLGGALVDRALDVLLR